MHFIRFGYRKGNNHESKTSEHSCHGPSLNTGASARERNRGNRNEASRKGASRNGASMNGARRSGANRAGANRAGANRAGANRAGANRAGANRTRANRTRRDSERNRVGGGGGITRTTLVGLSLWILRGSRVSGVE
jgi:hypothetical protein